MRVVIKRFLSFLFAFCLVFSFTVRLSQPASAADTVIQKILTTISATPVALVDPASITAATSTPGLTVTSAGWFDASGKALSGVFQPETYRIEIHVKADNGYVIASDVAAYLNNSAVTIQVENGGKTATLVREYTAAVWAPTIIKHPSAETVKEGGWASFAASASYVLKYEWYLEGPDGRQAVSVDDLHLTYPEVSATGNGSSKMNLYHIPYDLNGWKVVCNYVGAGNANSVKSQGALLTVIPTTSQPAVTAGGTDSDGQAATVQSVTNDQPSGENGTEPAANGSVEATAEDVSPADASAANGSGSPADAGEMPSTVPDPVFSTTWSSDARSHWHDSETGGFRAQEDLHSFVWYESEDGTQTGVCDVCGYTLTRRPAGAAENKGGTGTDPKAGSDPDVPKSSESPVKPNAAMYLLMALAPIDAGLIAAHALRTRKRTSQAEF